MEYGHRVLSAYPDADLEAGWRECQRNSRYATSYTGPEYFLEPSLNGKRPFAVLVFDWHCVVAALTGIYTDKTIQSGLDVRPQLCTRDGADTEAVSRALRNALRECSTRFERVVVHSWEPLEVRGFNIRKQPSASVLLDLSIGKDELFKQFSQTSRNQVRKAQKIGVSVAPLADEDFDELHTLYLDWCKFKGLPAESYDLRKAGCASSSRLVLVAKYEGKIVGASTFRFTPDGMMEYASNVSRREDSKVKQNDLLVWTAIEFACDKGLKTFSMGGAHFYLQKFGGEVYPTYRLSWDRTVLKKHHAREWIIDRMRQAYRRLKPIPA